MSRKKARLAWGDGLAKYEKKKVEVKSPRVLGFSECASFATPSSVACSSSPGSEEKSFGKSANIDNDIIDSCFVRSTAICKLLLLKGSPCPATFSSLPVEEHGKASRKQEAASTTSKFVEPLSLEKAISPSDIVKFHECSGDLGSVQWMTMEEVILGTGSGNEGTATTISAEGSVLKKIDNDLFVSEYSSSDAGGENIMYETTLATNKELANVASDVFNKLLPKSFNGIEISEIANVACTQSDTAIRGKIAMRKQYLRFKERVLTFKFKAFQNAWKEDMCSLSMRKCRAKSLKKYELSLRSTHGG
ncbi:hypothetical protein F3Y22_tig00110264pilonHSYRG00395 [Hibiscus syriacus]|uniref:Uncharacterized protein n=1 Tax=Hibiscus syriacus TaxID=106335 RepID=A0A6A3BAB3_HIBSY|nr:hypothetical protein F3Y22_tig00110264pilonHSYRG00395 [Hibiscus syriacus]